MRILSFSSWSGLSDIEGIAWFLSGGSANDLAMLYLCSNYYRWENGSKQDGKTVIFSSSDNSISTEAVLMALE